MQLQWHFTVMEQQHGETCGKNIIKKYCRDNIDQNIAYEQNLGEKL